MPPTGYYYAVLASDCEEVQPLFITPLSSLPAGEDLVNKHVLLNLGSAIGWKHGIVTGHGGRGYTIRFEDGSTVSKKLQERSHGRTNDWVLLTQFESDHKLRWLRAARAVPLPGGARQAPSRAVLRKHALGIFTT
jgi:hypothetical protein